MNSIGIFKRKKKSDNKLVTAQATFENGKWTLLKGSVLGIVEDAGVSQKAKDTRKNLSIDDSGTLLEDAYLGEVTPCLAATVVLNQYNNGWIDWKNSAGQPIDIYREKKDSSDEE